MPLPLDPRFGQGVGQAIDEQTAIAMADSVGQSEVARSELAGMWNTKGSPFDEQKVFEVADKVALDELESEKQMTAEPLDEATAIRMADVEVQAGLKKPTDIETSMLPVLPGPGAVTPFVSRQMYGVTTSKDPRYKVMANIMDGIFQAGVGFKDKVFWGLPGVIFKGLSGKELPKAQTKTGEIGRAVGELAGLGTGVASPFKVSGRVAEKIFAREMKTIPGQFIKDALKGATSLGIALGASSWEGENPRQIVETKLDQAISGAKMGGVFFGTSFLKFAKKFPILSWAARFGTTSAILDSMDNKSVLDERTLTQKVFDYGLNAYFTRHGTSPREYIARESERRMVEKEIKTFNAEAAKDGLDVKIDFYVSPGGFARPAGGMTPEQRGFREMGRVLEEPVEGAAMPTGIEPRRLEKHEENEPLFKKEPPRPRGELGKAGRRLADDAPDIWHDIMAVTGGEGVGTRDLPPGKRAKNAPLFAKRLLQKNEYDELPNILKNRASPYSFDIVVDMLQKGSETIRGNYSGLNEAEIYDLIFREKPKATKAEDYAAAAEGAKDEIYDEVMTEAMVALRKEFTMAQLDEAHGRVQKAPLRQVIDDAYARKMTPGDARRKFEDAIRAEIGKPAPKAEPKPLGDGGAFDTTTTGMPYYDTLLKNPQYMESRKHRVGKIEYMSPDEYIRRSGANRTSPLSVEGEMVGTRPKRVSELEALVRAGTKMPMPVIDTVDKAQEGRHRALMAKSLGLKEIPVLVVSKGREAHEMPSSVWLGDKLEHEWFVREALKRGDVVPPEVLAEYPQLQQTAPKAESKTPEGVVPVSVERPGQKQDRRTKPELRALVEKAKRGEASTDEVSYVIDELGTDSLTDVPGRAMFDLIGAKDKPQAFVDPDSLKATNDKNGYEAGDALLKRVVDRLREIPNADVYRTGGDEFAVIPRDGSLERIGVEIRKAQEELDAKGDGFSFGLGKDRASASVEMQLQKKGRKAPVQPSPAPPPAPPEIAAPAAPSSSKGFIDANFTSIAKKVGVRPESLGEIYEKALANWKPREGEDPAEGLKNYIANQNNLVIAGRVEPSSGKSTYREKERMAPELKEELPAESAIGRTEETERQDALRSVFDILDKSGLMTDEQRAAMDDVVSGKPVRQRKGQAALKKLAPTIELIQKAHADPEVRRKVGEEFDRLDAKKKAGTVLTPKEHEAWAIGGAIKDGLQKFNMGPRPDVPEWAEEAMKRVADDMMSMGKKRGHVVFKRIQEAIRLPEMSPRTKGVADFLQRIQEEADTVTSKVNRKAKEYIALQERNKPSYEKVNEALIAEDRHHRLIARGELKSKFGLNERELAAYDGVRDAIRYIQRYEMHRNSQMLREKRDELIKKADTPEKYEEIDKAYEEALTHVGEAYKNNPGYVPHMRFGDFGIVIKGRLVRKPGQERLAGEAGEEVPKGPITANFSAFDLESQARRFSSQYKVGQRVEFDGRTFDITEVGAPINLAEKGVNPQSYIQAIHAFPVYEKLLAKKLMTEAEAGGQADYQAIQRVREIIGEEALKFYARGRLARRRNIAGWDKDIGRSLENFFESFPRAVSRRYSISKAEKIIDAMPDADKKYAVRLLEYWEGKSRTEGQVNQGLRRVLYNWFLGFKPSFYFVNAMQPVQTSLPLAQSMVGAKAPGVFLKASGKTFNLVRDYVRERSKFRDVDLLDVVKDAKYLTTADKRALASALESGQISASRTREIIGKKGVISTPMEAAGTLSEKQNRIHATLMATEIAKIKGINTADAIELARTFTGKSQFVYSKANRPEVMRGAAAPALIFKTYFLNYWRLQGELFKTDKKAFATSQAILLGLGGALGYPFSKELIGLTIKGLRLVGALDDEENFRKQVYDIQKKVDKNTAGMLLHGVPALGGLLGDAMFGSGEFAGLAPLQIWTGAKRFKEGLSTWRSADEIERLARVSPTMLKHVLRTYQIAVQKHMPLDEYGKPKISDADLKTFPKDIRAWAKDNRDDLPGPSDIPLIEKALYAAGFPTRKISEYQGGAYQIRGVAREVRLEKGGLNLEIGKLFGENIEAQNVIRRIMAKNDEGKYELGSAAFKGHFRMLVKKLPEDIQAQISDAIDRADKKGYRLNHASILSQIREYLERRRMEED